MVKEDASAPPDPIEQYELPADDFDPEVHAEPSHVPAETPEVVADDRPRGPDGKFLPKVKTHEHSPRLASMARHAGLSSEDIALKSPDELRQELADIALERQLTPPKIAPESPAAPKPEPKVEAPAELDLGLTDENCTPEIQAAIGKLKDHFGAQLKAITDQLGQVSNYVQTQASQAAAQTVDDQFAGRPELFGKKKFAEMDDADKGSEEFFRRQCVIERVKRMDKEPGTLAEKTGKAIQAIFGGGRAPKPAEEEPVTKPPQNGRITTEQWNASTLAAPTRRNNANEPSGVRKAERGVAEWQRNKGLNVGGDEESTIDV